MVDQETITTHGVPSHGPPANHSDHEEGLFHRIISLAELQFRLFRLDFRDGFQYVITLGIALVCLSAMSVATCGIALMYIAELLADTGGFPRSTSYLISAIIGFLVAVGLAVTVVLSLRACLHIFDRSAAEWRRTIVWMKHATRHHANGRPEQPNTWSAPR